MTSTRNLPPRRLAVRPRLRLNALERRDVPSIALPLSTSTWTEMGPSPIISGFASGSFPPSGRAAAVAVHPTNPDIVYSGAASGGVWKTTNATATNPAWTPVTDNEASLNTGAIAIAPSNPNIVYVGTGEAAMASVDCFYGRGVLKSSDAGATWTLLGTKHFDRTVISAVVVHPTDPNTVFVAVAGPGQPGAGKFAPGLDGDPTKPTGIFRSTDGGLNWTNISTSVTTLIGYSDLEPDPTNINVMYAGVGVRQGAAACGVYKTSNALAATPTWTLVSNIVSGTTVGRTEIAIAKSNPQVVYVTMQDAATTGVLRFYQSTNGGTSWNDRTSNLPSMSTLWYSNVLLVDPVNSNTVYFASTTSIVRTTNGGTSFLSIFSGADGKSPHVDFHDFAFDSLGRMLVACDGGMYRYTPSTNLWAGLNGINATRNTSTALGTIQFTGIAIHPTDPNFLIGGTQDNGTLKFNDSLGWTGVQGGDGGDVVLDPFNPSRMWQAEPVASFGSGAFMRRSTDGGSSWSSVTDGIVNASSAFFYPPVQVDPATPNRVFLGTNVVNVTTNGADNWGRLPGDTFTFPGPIRAIAVGPTSSTTIYVGVANSLSTINHVFVTTNNGVTWTDRTPPGSGDYINIEVDPANALVAYVVSANFSPTGDNLWKTTNGGASWVSISATLPDAPCYDIVIDPGPTNSSSDDVLYAGGDFGVYRSLDLGTTWTEFGLSLPNGQVRDLEFAPITRILAANVRGRGAWEILTGTPTTPGYIAGQVYRDLNGNGSMDAGDPGLAGWTVWRDDNNNGVIDTVGSSTKSSTNVPVNIVDFTTVTSKLTISGLTGSISDLNVKLSITHTYDGDMQAFLMSPSGAKVELFAGVGGPGQNFTDTVLDDEAPTSIVFGAAPFTGSFQATGLLAAFDGLSPNGDWILSINDIGPGDEGTLDSWSLTITTGEASVISASNGAYQFVNQPNGAYTIRRVLQSGYTATEPITGAHTVTLTSMAGVFGRNFGQTQIPAKVNQVIVNDGSVQRSRVTQLTVVFDSIVNFASSPANAFKLVRTGPGAPNGEPAGLVTLTAVNNTTNHTEAVLTFSGSLTDFTSLIDGNYTLTVLANQFSGAGFDGDGNGTAGDNYTTTLHRLFGDVDGDRTVSTADFTAFRTAFGGVSFAFDFNNSGTVDTLDFSNFRIRFGSSI